MSDDMGNSDIYSVRPKEEEEVLGDWAEEWMKHSPCISCGSEDVGFLMGTPPMPVCQACMLDREISIPVFRHYAERKKAGLTITYEDIQKVMVNGYVEVCDMCSKLITGMTLKQINQNRTAHKSKCKRKVPSVHGEFKCCLCSAVEELSIVNNVMLCPDCRKRNEDVIS